MATAPTSMRPTRSAHASSGATVCSVSGDTYRREYWPLSALCRASASVAAPPSAAAKSGVASPSSRCTRSLSSLTWSRAREMSGVMTIVSLPPASARAW